MPPTFCSSRATIAPAPWPSTSFRCVLASASLPSRSVGAARCTAAHATSSAFVPAVTANGFPAGPRSHVNVGTPSAASRRTTVGSWLATTSAASGDRGASGVSRTEAQAASKRIATGAIAETRRIRRWCTGLPHKTRWAYPHCEIMRGFVARPWDKKGL